MSRFTCKGCGSQYGTRSGFCIRCVRRNRIEKSRTVLTMIATGLNMKDVATHLGLCVERIRQIAHFGQRTFFTLRVDGEPYGGYVYDTAQKDQVL